MTSALSRDDCNADSLASVKTAVSKSSRPGRPSLAVVIASPIYAFLLIDGLRLPATDCQFSQCLGFTPKHFLGVDFRNVAAEI